MNNPKFDFYAKLLTVLGIGNMFKLDLARKVVEIFTVNRAQIGLLDEVTIEQIGKWHEIIHRDAPEGGRMTLGQSIEGLDDLEMLSEQIFIDLAPQMRSRAVQDLHFGFKALSCLPDGDLFVHIRRQKDLGNGFAAVTIITDNAEGFRELWADPDEYIRMKGEIHFSLSEELAAAE